MFQFSFSNFSYEYAIKDHLGNTRVVFDQTGKVLQDQSYYPFGMSMGEELTYNMPDNLPDNKYLYNGKELQMDFDLGWYDYGARFYDPQIGRWHVVDPKAEEREWLSPYNYVQNNPILRIDPDGALDDIVITGENNSSVTIKTDLIDVEVNASSIVGDMGGNYTLEGDDIVEAGLDIVGIVDPTGVADVASASLQISKGEYGGAILSGLGVIPYVGDLGKLGKIPKHLKTIDKSIDAIKGGKSVSAKTFKEADDILFGAFPDAQKIKGAGNKSKSKMMSQQRQFKGTHKDGKYHKDFKRNKNGNIYGHDNLPDGHPHKTTPHINVKTPSGKKTTIYIDK